MNHGKAREYKGQQRKRQESERNHDNAKQTSNIKQNETALNQRKPTEAQINQHQSKNITGNPRKAKTHKENKGYKGSKRK